METIIVYLKINYQHQAIYLFENFRLFTPD